MTRPTDANCAPSERISQRAELGPGAPHGVGVGSALRVRTAQLACGLAAGVLAAACNLNNPGVTPPEGALSFPMAVALSPGDDPRYLYIANSNFDLRYNAGSVHAYDLAELEAQLRERGCRDLERNVRLDGGTRSFPDNTMRAPMDGGVPMVPADGGAALDAGVPQGDGGAGEILLPGDYNATSAYDNKRGVLCDGRDPSPEYRRCCFDEDELGRADMGSAPVRRASMPIDSFASGIAVAPSPTGRGERVYVPVSSRSSLVYADFDGTSFVCERDDGRCRQGPRFRGDDDDPEHEFPGQPSAVTIGKLADLGLTSGDAALMAQGITPDATYIATAHERGGVGLFVEKGGAPVLESVVDLSVAWAARNTNPLRPTSISLNPLDKLLYVTFAGQAFISRVGMRVSSDGIPGERGPRELLYQSGNLTVTGLEDSRDLRDVAVDPRDPSLIYVLVRGIQETVAFFKVDPGGLDPTGGRLLAAVRIGAGPSKLDYITMDDGSADGRGFLLVSCYDARAIYIIDVERRALVALVRNLSGPYEMAFDARRRLLHVADFRSSVLRVVDLSWLVDKSEPPPRIIATLGRPRFEGELE